MALEFLMQNPNRIIKNQMRTQIFLTNKKSNNQKTSLHSACLKNRITHTNKNVALGYRILIRESRQHILNGEYQCLWNSYRRIQRFLQFLSENSDSFAILNGESKWLRNSKRIIQILTFPNVSLVAQTGNCFPKSFLYYTDLTIFFT